MTITTEYEQALALVRRLDRPTRARFVAQVVQELADEPEESDRRSRKAWDRLTQLREAYAQMEPVSPSPAEQLEHDRQQRADLLEGRVRE